MINLKRTIEEYVSMLRTRTIIGAFAAPHIAAAIFIMVAELLGGTQGIIYYQNYTIVIGAILSVIAFLKVVSKKYPVRITKLMVWSDIMYIGGLYAAFYYNLPIILAFLIVIDFVLSYMYQPISASVSQLIVKGDIDVNSNLRDVAMRSAAVSSGIVVAMTYFKVPTLAYCVVAAIGFIAVRRISVILVEELMADEEPERRIITN